MSMEHPRRSKTRQYGVQASNNRRKENFNMDFRIACWRKVRLLVLE